MEVDFGGIAKEYAVDRGVSLAKAAAPSVAVLVNLGGDLAVTQAPRSGYWRVGQESAANPDVHEAQDGVDGDSNESDKSPAEFAQAERVFNVVKGALATSGNRYRSIELDGRIYGHILNPRTGWPVEESPMSVTVAGARCTEAGVLSTLALLQGIKAEAFLDAAGCQYWCQRP